MRAPPGFRSNPATKWLGLSDTGFLAYRTDTPTWSRNTASPAPTTNPPAIRKTGDSSPPMTEPTGPSSTSRKIRLSPAFGNHQLHRRQYQAYKYYALKITANRGRLHSTRRLLALLSRPLRRPSESQHPDGRRGEHSDENGPDQGVAEAFDQTNTTKWLAFGPTAWLQYAAPSGQAYLVSQYPSPAPRTITAAIPRIGSFSAPTMASPGPPSTRKPPRPSTGRLATNTYTIDNPIAYQFYRLNITANAGGGDTQLADLNLFGSVVGRLRGVTAQTILAAKCGQNAVPGGVNLNCVPRSIPSDETPPFHFFPGAVLPAGHRRCPRLSRLRRADVPVPAIGIGNAPAPGFSLSAPVSAPLLDTFPPMHATATAIRYPGDRKTLAALVAHIHKLRMKASCSHRRSSLPLTPIRDPLPRSQPTRPPRALMFFVSRG